MFTPAGRLTDDGLCARLTFIRPTWQGFDGEGESELDDSKK
jgi:hypothetical protein